MHTVYVAMSLTHVRDEAAKSEIRRFFTWLESEFSVEILMWAFDLEKWEPLPVENIFEYDYGLLSTADLVIVAYLSNDGSDGRGGEVADRINLGLPILPILREGVKVSRYPLDRFKRLGIPVATFRTLDDLREPIREALAAIPDRELARTD